MPRLLRVRALCDACRRAEASLYCAQHRDNLCISCDAHKHAQDEPLGHTRVSLDSVLTALTVCQRCDRNPASVYCETKCGAICNSCETSVTHGSSFSHSHRPLREVLADRPVSFMGPTNPESEHEFSLQPQSSTREKSSNLDANVLKARMTITEDGKPGDKALDKYQENSAELKSSEYSKQDESNSDVQSDANSAMERNRFLERLWPSDVVFFQEPSAEDEYLDLAHDKD
mmetsp:Transcript_11276/g.34522  ORF Transcript_11276/g.34522 Transcript_11276/m.34522 type:complete len:230 (-) Transcript_11276:176-865(-)